MDMDAFLIILHVVLCFTLLPFLMKGCDMIFKVVAVVISLCATPVAMVLGPAAAFIGYGCIWIFSKLSGLPPR
mgnify:FL=1|jgi:hypothetical protein